MKSEHIPTRMCVVCMQMKPKSDLLRLTKLENGQIVVDKSQKRGGRGVWVDKNAECISNLRKRKCLERKFKSNIDEKLFEEINKALDE